ncbi:transcription termination factor NusA [Candidatus Cytomitobacter indipagum]|uniref:Transcription termination/antitermination protein NusA n=1 Tax=Candidatus Cytomitobacter indipagum TaxID=2601575 RepID=A0A5C0UFR1_9PROT|nr:transcription termination factor NusA [Candidatus Cytomitobacter indipagum]QEK38092.1 transcription termination factor NusA [Candidatus Cytomitobacter indipagum]
MNTPRNISKNVELAPRSDELIESLFQLASEKNLNTTLLFEIVEDSIREVLARTKGDIPIDVKIDIDNKTICIYAIKTIVEDEPQDIYEISLEEALKSDPDAEIDGQARELIGTGFSSMPFMRTSINAVRKLLQEKIMILEKEAEFDTFSEKKNTMISARVKSISFGNIILDIKGGEGYMHSSEIIPGETFKINQEIKAYIYQVEENQKGPQVMLSRKHPGMLEYLFDENVPEIGDKISIRAIAREAGSKSKVAVTSEDPDIDPIGSCIGKNGDRIKAVMRELSNEKIDIINWSDDLITLVINAIYPAEIVKVVVKDENDIELVIKDDNMHIAIGRDGQNVRLARKLTKCKIKISSETEYKAEELRIANKAREEFKEIGMNDDDIELFIENGILSCNAIVENNPDEIKEIEGISLNNEEMEDLIHKANEKCIANYTKIATELESKIDSPDDRITIEEIASLAQNGILTNEDVAYMDTYDMIDIIGNKFSKYDVDEIIMNFRKDLGIIDEYFREDEGSDDKSDENTSEDGSYDEDGNFISSAEKSEEGRSNEPDSFDENESSDEEKTENSPLNEEKSDEHKNPSENPSLDN